MSDNLSDTQIRANLRTLMAESGIDPNRTSFTCARGIVRMFGAFLGLCNRPVRSKQIEELERALRNSPGIQRIHFEPEDFERQPTGEWREAGQRK